MCAASALEKIHAKLPLRLAYLVTHPIQYQSPLLRRIAQDRDIDLTVFFCSMASARTFKDPEFQQVISWDSDVLGGYHHKALPHWGHDGSITALRPFNHGLIAKLQAGNFDALWVHGYARPLHLYALAWAHRHGLRTLLRDEVHAFSRPRSALREGIKAKLFHWLDQRVDRFLATGTPNREYYLSHGIDKAKIKTMPYAVDNVAFAARAHDRGEIDALRKELQLRGDRPVLLFAGKLIPRKGAADLITSCKALLQERGSGAFYLLVVGSGPQRQALEEMIGPDEKEAIRFVGFQNQSRLPLYYALADLFVFPSHWEAWGLAINEAMACGTPVLASQQSGAVPDLVVDGKTGATFPAGDIAALSGAIASLIDQPDQLWVLGAGARTRLATWDYEQDLRALRSALGLALEPAERASP